MCWMSECEAADQTGRGCVSWQRCVHVIIPFRQSSLSGNLSSLLYYDILSRITRTFTMGSWKTHVRARLQQRDLNEKVPFVGVYTSCAQTLRIFLFAIMIHVMNVGLNNLPVSPQYFSWKSASKLANTFWMTSSP